MTNATWYARPEGEVSTLGKQPRLASWNKNTDPDQVRLREYVQDAAELVAPHVPNEPWAVWLDVGLTHGRGIIETPDLDNYIHPLATRVRDSGLVSVWCTKRHNDISRFPVGRAQEVPAPSATFDVRTTASSEKQAYKEHAWSRPGPCVL